jgi:putative hydrolase of the HAD superfamily
MTVHNIIFDIGNVLVRWEPLKVIQRVFPNVDAQALFQAMRPIWLDLNLGKLTEKEAVQQYENLLNFPKEKFQQLMLGFKESQTPIEGSLEFLKELKQLGYSLFSITDNIHEIMAYHRQHSAFTEYFKDIIVSADLGALKPDPKIYQNLLDKHQLKAEECVFFDDLLTNVEGAKGVGMQAFLFIDTATCRKDLENLLGKKL